MYRAMYPPFTDGGGEAAGDAGCECTSPAAAPAPVDDPPNDDGPLGEYGKPPWAIASLWRAYSRLLLVALSLASWEEKAKAGKMRQDHRPSQAQGTRAGSVRGQALRGRSSACRSGNALYCCVMCGCVGVWVSPGEPLRCERVPPLPAGAWLRAPQRARRPLRAPAGKAERSRRAGRREADAEG